MGIQKQYLKKPPKDLQPKPARKLMVKIGADRFLPAQLVNELLRQKGKLNHEQRTYLNGELDIERRRLRDEVTTIIYGNGNDRSERRLEPQWVKVARRRVARWEGVRRRHEKEMNDKASKLYKEAQRAILFETPERANRLLEKMRALSFKKKRK